MVESLHDHDNGLSAPADVGVSTKFAWPPIAVLRLPPEATVMTPLAPTASESTYWLVLLLQPASLILPGSSLFDWKYSAT